MFGIGAYHFTRSLTRVPLRRDWYVGLKLVNCYSLRTKTSDYVGLNVGGKIYRTSRLTLTRYPDSFFSTLLDGDIPSERDKQGNYLIDQDGEIFRHVLNFLRYGELKLPEGFNELGLLRSQADFFSLQVLKNSTENYSSRSDVPIGGSVGLMFDDRKLFNITKETLSREEDSLFTKMLKGEVSVFRDPQGNYLMNRHSSGFYHILNYLRDGGILNRVTSDDLNRLEEDAKYFGLDVLGSHIQSIQHLARPGYNEIDPIHVYWCPSSPCVAYAPYFNYLFNIEIIHDVGGIQSGVLDTDKINPNGPASIQDVENYLRKLIISKHSNEYSRRQVQVKHVRINSNCTRLEAFGIKFWTKEHRYTQ